MANNNKNISPKIGKNTSDHKKCIETVRDKLQLHGLIIEDIKVIRLYFERDLQ